MTGAVSSSPRSSSASAGTPSLAHFVTYVGEGRGSALAVLEAERCFDYPTISAWSDVVVRRLRDAGAGSGAPIGVCTRQGADLIVAFLGVLRAGNAFVPLDPRYPVARLEAIVADVGVRIAIADDASQSLCHRLGLESIPSALDGAATVARAALAAAASEAELAYVIYTSGSSGGAKGVGVSRAALAGHIRRAGPAYDLTPDDTVLLALSPSFDASIEVTSLTLAAGATLAFLDGDLQDVSSIVEAIATQGATVAVLPPPAWDAVTELGKALTQDPLRSLRLIVTGGQASTIDQVARWRVAVPDARVLNLYGPSEAVVSATAYTVEPGSPLRDGDRSLPIGSALPDTQVLLLDDDTQPVRPGEVGEIFIGGPILAHGYINDPGATASRFLPNPNALVPGERMYRTGDFARAGEDGELRFEGRRDAQVQIRGHRVELAEVETALASHPAVLGGVAAAVHVNGDMRLNGYVVLRAGQKTTPRDVRDFVARLLPPHAVPSVVVALDELPRTGSGKVDRRALPPADPAVDRALAPQTPDEEAVACAWRDVLGLDYIGTRDNFFDLGGHSLLATRAIGRLREELGMQIPVRAIFDAPTIEGFVHLIAEFRGESGRGE